MLWHQCCVCRLPHAPADWDRHMITHGYHRACFIAHYEHSDPDMVTEEEMAVLDASDSWVEEDTQLKVAPYKG